MSMTKLQLTAITALRHEGLKATKENVNRIVSSMVTAGASNNSSIDELATTASIAVESFNKFKGTKLLSKSVKEEVQTTAKYEQCGMSCPRCGRPMVYAKIRTRNVGYCTGNCHIALPFKKNDN